MSVSDDERKVIYFVNAAISSVSLLGSSVIIAMFTYFKDLRGYGFAMICVLSIFDVINCISFLIPTYEANSDDSSCVIQAALLSFSTTAGIIWSTIIAWSLYRIIVVSKTDLSKTLMRNLIFTVVISSVVMIIPIITQSYGTVAGWCWIQFTGKIGENFYERVFLFVIPVFIAIVANSFLYILISRDLVGANSDEEKIAANKSLSKKLKYYPCILAICYLPYTIKQAVELTSVSQHSYEFSFTLIAGAIRCMHGLLNTFVYGFSNKVKKKLLNLQQRCCNKNYTSEDLIITPSIQ